MKSSAVALLSIGILISSCFYLFFYSDENTELKLEKMHVLIDNDAYKILSEFRDEALNKGFLERSPEDYVATEIIYRSTAYSGKIRLKGDWLDHLAENKWSFRVKLDTPMPDGIKKFSVQNIGSRGHLNGIVFYQLMQDEGVLCNEFRLIELIVNKQSWGIYFFEEQPSTRMVIQQKPNGLIMKYSDQLFFHAEKDGKSTNNLIRYSKIKVYGDAKKQKKHKASLDKAKEIMHSYQIQSEMVYNSFDYEIMGKYYALCDITCAYHAMGWINMRFYFNFETQKMEPVAYDPYPIMEWGKPYLGKHFSNYKNDPLETKMIVYNALKNDSIYKYYEIALRKYSSLKYISQFFHKYVDNIRFLESEIKKEDPDYRFDYSFIQSNCRDIRTHISSD
jgi:hypothetical protein